MIRHAARRDGGLSTGEAKRISQRQSQKHTDEAVSYFHRVRSRLYKDEAYRGKFVAIRDRQIVDVDGDNGEMSFLNSLDHGMQ